MLTVLILLPLLLAAIWWLSPVWFYVLLCALGLLAAEEWIHIAGAGHQVSLRYGYLLGCALILLGLWFVRGLIWPWLAALSIIWWLLVLWLVCAYPQRFNCRPSALMLAMAGQLLWPPTILCLLVLRGQTDGAEKLLYALALVWAADTGAYLAGRALGRHKLAPKVSPGKTREGAVGGLVLCLLWALAAGEYAFALAPGALAWLVLISLLAALASILGDLGMSLFKRLSGLKDSGQLLPGHGGVLDRVDSLFAATPVLVLGLWFSGILR